MTELKLCNTCSRPMIPTHKYKPYQSQCWDCWGRENDKNEGISGGHVYIAEYFNMYTQETQPWMYKVGMTERQNAQKRVAEIGDTLGPMKVRIVRHWQSEDPRELEKRLHNKLKHNKICGEWFSINKDELIRIINETVQPHEQDT